MQTRILYNYHAEKNRLKEQKRFRIFLFTQFAHYGTLFVLLLGGLFFIVFAIKTILNS